MRLEDWLDDLCVRFIINLPGDDLSSVERICFQVEEAQWYYEDFIRPLDPSLPSLSLRSFSLRIFAHCPLLSAFSQGDHMAAFEEFLIYKRRIPVRGAILLNHDMDSVVLVKGWKKGANWSFPRGKINKDEDDLICAIREVYEETGYNLQTAGLVPENGEVKHITLPIRDQDIRLYVFRDIPMDTYFEPKTRKEISKIQWWRIADLPGFRKKGQQQPEAATNPNKFYMVASFLRDLRKWIIEQKKVDAQRVTSNQYLSAGMSHDEFLTEEDLGAESAQEPNHAKSSVPTLDTLEGATAALKSLLKVQPPTQGLQPEAVKSPLPKDSGSELLALLQGKSQVASQSTPLMAPQTPLNQTLSQYSQPKTPHQHQYRPAPFSSQALPPVYPLPQPSNSLPHQVPSLSRNQEQPHNQSQHLVHPQPLPPHVQRAVFTGGPLHAPMAQQPVQQQYAPLQSSTSTATIYPQFPSTRSPIVPPVPIQEPPKLTSHKLALLNAFKTRDGVNEGNAVAADLPMRRFVEELASPQELPAETPHPPAVDLLSLFKAKDSPTQVSNSTIPPLRPAISDAQRSTLLGLFKSPTPKNSAPSISTATALPISATPSAVELSAVEPLSNTGPISTRSSSAYNTALAEETTEIPGPNPEAILPFRALSILTRPSQTTPSRANGSSSGASGSSPPRPRQDVNQATKKASKLQQGRGAQQEKNIRSKPTPEKPFQPQILKRPQPVSLATVEASTPQLQSFSSLPLTSRTQSLLQTQVSPELSSALPAQPSLNGQTADQREALLSLFGKSKPTTVPFAQTLSSELQSSLEDSSALFPESTKSRVGSLTTGVDGTSRRTSQATMSPADKSFLLSYLDSVANSSKR